MKQNRFWALCALVLVLLMLCTGCKALLQSFDNPQVHQKADAMLDALIGDDFDVAYGLVSHLCSEADFAPVYAEMRAFLGEAKTYELAPLSIYTNTRISGGQQYTTIDAEYEMSIPGGTIIVTLQTLAPENTITAFQLTPYEKTNYYATGTVENMRGATAWQWILLLTNLITIGVTVYAFVDCCRHNIKRKVLWLLLLILGFLTLGVTIAAKGFHANFNIGSILAYSALILYGSGTIQLRLMLPVGAIIYFIARRSLLRPAPTAPIVKETFPENPAEDTLEPSQTDESHSENPPE